MDSAYVPLVFHLQKSKVRVRGKEWAVWVYLECATHRLPGCRHERLPLLSRVWVQVSRPGSVHELLLQTECFLRGRRNVRCC